jgi:hypothetical protein
MSTNTISQLSNSPPDTSTATELTLKVGEPLLFVLTPYSPKNAWWQERKGILTLLPDGVVDLNSDYLSCDGRGNEIINVSHQYFKQAMREGWSVYMACCAKPTIWYDFNPVPWQYEPDRVIISADSCDWKLHH